MLKFRVPDPSPVSVELSQSASLLNGPSSRPTGLFGGQVLGRLGTRPLFGVLGDSCNSGVFLVFAYALLAAVKFDIFRGFVCAFADEDGFLAFLTDLNFWH